MTTKFAPTLNSQSTLHLAMRLEKQLAARYEAYRAECEAYAADGFRPARCEHGTSNWTDYDNICGPCEDGVTMAERGQRLAYALDEAKSRAARAKALFEAVEALRSEGIETDMGPVWERIGSLMAY